MVRPAHVITKAIMNMNFILLMTYIWGLVEKRKGPAEGQGLKNEFTRL
jgi:hypothetical protein